jgi:hypothetical protein
MQIMRWTEPELRISFGRLGNGGPSALANGDFRAEGGEP